MEMNHHPAINPVSPSSRCIIANVPNVQINTLGAC